DPDRYRTAARQVADWLISVASVELGGVTWLAQPGVSAAAEPSMGWGALGPMVFFADAYRTAGDASSLEMAGSGLRWLRAVIGCEGQDMPPGLCTGLAGSAVVFSEMERGRRGCDGRSGQSLRAAGGRRRANRRRRELAGDDGGPVGHGGHRVRA